MFKWGKTNKILCPNPLRTLFFLKKFSGLLKIMKCLFSRESVRSQGLCCVLVLFIRLFYCSIPFFLEYSLSIALLQTLWLSTTQCSHQPFPTKCEEAGLVQRWGFCEKLEFQEPRTTDFVEKQQHSWPAWTPHDPCSGNSDHFTRIISSALHGNLGVSYPYLIPRWGNVDSISPVCPWSYREELRTRIWIPACLTS